MAKAPASIQLTGGAGHEFEDKVAAFFATAMLAGTQPLGPGVGGITKLDWQARESGWLLDDLLVTLSRPTVGRLAISIKSDRQVTSSGFPNSFVTGAWEQWLGRGTPASSFDKSTDLLGLVVGELAEEPREAWNELLREALVTDSARLARRYSTARMTSQTGRSLFTSLRRPTSLASTPTSTDDEIGEIVRGIRLVHLDFTSPTSMEFGNAIRALQGTIQSGSSQEAHSLWLRMCGICTVRRTAGGSLSKEDLIRELCSEFQLRAAPDHAAQWERLHRHSSEHATRARRTLGGGVSINRLTQLRELHHQLDDKGAVLVTGSGGCGKSALARSLVDDESSYSQYLWLDSETLAERSPSELDAYLGLTVPLKTLIAESSPKSSAIVLDGLDRFSDYALATVADLLGALTTPWITSGWAVIATARAESAAGLLARFQQTGVAGSFSTWALDPPDRAEVQAALRQIPAMVHLSARVDLIDALRNLKLFDWVASSATSTFVPEAESWVGHLEVYDWVWAHWLGATSGRLARGSALKALGAIDGGQLTSGVGLLQIQATDADVIEELCALDLVRVQDERIYFSHDLVGDISRLRILIENQNEQGGLFARANAPRWHAAIRLLGQRLAERTTTTMRAWKRAFEDLDDKTSEGALARNLLIEGVARATNSGHLLELLWPEMTSDNGILLNRFLEAFQYVATVPDPRIDSLGLRADAKADLAAAVRVPSGTYWVPVLTVLAAHTQDVCRLAPVEAGKVVGLWLRTMPTETPGRPQAAQIALALGREMQVARGVHYRAERDEQDHIFEAVLDAAPDCPDEVAQLALELAQRRSEPPQIAERREFLREEERLRQAEWLSQNPLPSHLYTSSLVHQDDGVPLPPLVDGPAARVDAGFQRVVLRSQVICRLAVVRPDAAREVLLGCSLRLPFRPRFGGDSDPLQLYGVETTEQGRPPFYSSGPWLAWLRLDPVVAIDVIVRLVNQATMNWARSARRSEESAPNSQCAPTVLIRIHGEAKPWTGDSHVYMWYRQHFIGSDTVVAALMALERWFYDEIDGGRPIIAAIQQVWATSSSSAFLGVLTAVALRNPELLDKPLSPLLGVWQLDEWSQRLAQDERYSGVELMPWHRHGEAATRDAIAWNTLPHRRLSTREQFVRAFLSRPAVRNAFIAIRQHWADEATLHPESNKTISRLLAMFDIDNYTISQPDAGSVAFKFKFPPALESETSAAAAHATKAMAFLFFPRRCRALLDKNEPLTPESAESLWLEMQELADFTLGSEADGPAGPVRKREDIVAGAVTALAILAPEWLENHRDRIEWCKQELLQIRQSPPAISLIDTFQSPSTDTWHAFLAELAIHQLAASPNEVEVRWRAAESVACYWHSTTGIAMRTAYRLRHKLGMDFNRLANLAALWAALNGTRMNYDESDSEFSCFRARYGRLISAFGRKTIPSERLNWTEVGRIGREAFERLDAKRFPGKYVPMEASPEDDSIEGKLNRAIQGRAGAPRSHPGYDLQVVKAAYAWLPDALAHPSPDRDMALECVEDLLAVSIGMMPAVLDQDDDDDVEGMPYDFDRWLYGLITEIVPTFESSEKASRLWRPILTLGPQARYWVEEFLSNWTTTGFQSSPSPKAFFDRWNEMIAFAEGSPIWNPPAGESHARLGDLWKHLLGMDLGAPVIAELANEPFLAAMLPVYVRWTKRWLHGSWRIRDLCHLLLQPGAKGLRLSALAWLRDAMLGSGEFRLERADINALVVRFLRLVWSESSSQIATDLSVRSAFLALVNGLATTQCPEALLLRDAVARTTGPV